jgi:HD superfamily phosphohydrolase
VAKHHEKWTAEIIRNPAGNIRPLLDAFSTEENFCEAVAGLLEDEDPKDIYHAVVSSSFDADRLDYLRRDRLMTGTGAGAIDFDWLMEQVRVHKIEIEAPDAGSSAEAVRVPTFCFDPKALPAAEQFLLARYTLHEQVYFHKTTRCFEQMIAKLLRIVAKYADKRSTIKETGLDKDHPLLRFFAKNGETLENYLALDDIVITDAIRQLRLSPDVALGALAIRLRDRDLYKTLDLASFGHDDGVQRKNARRIDQNFSAKIKSEQIIKDESAVASIYTQIGGDDERAHKRLHILDARKGPVEITEVSKLIETLRMPKRYTRYYFEQDTDRDAARPERRDQHD